MTRQKTQELLCAKAGEVMQNLDVRDDKTLQKT